MLGTVLTGVFIHSFIEFHCKALNKTDIYPALKDSYRLLWETV